MLCYTQIAHIVCHSQSDIEAPSPSYLAFLEKPVSGDTSTPPTLAKLTLEMITRRDLLQASIIFLSACSTAQVCSEELQDEVLHLASGFLAAGYCHVIASMWPVMDLISPEFAESFWTTVLSKPVQDGDDRLVAVAVHKAVVYVRDDLCESPWAWGPYVHWGA
jgi:CHAT domain-containing protein